MGGRWALLLLMAGLMAACGEPGAAPDSARTHVCIATNADGLASHTFNQLAITGARGAGAQVQIVASHATSDYLSSLQRCATAHPGARDARCGLASA